MPEAAAAQGVHRGTGFQPAFLKVVSIAFTIFVVGYILIPIVVTQIMSFKDANMIQFPIATWSLK